MPSSNLTHTAPAKPNAILFDWDNTLVNTWPTIHDAMNHTLVHFGMTPWSMDETRSRVRKSMRNTFPSLFGEAWLDAADVFYGRYQAIHVDRLEPLPGAEELLAYLHQQQVFSSVVSNKVGNYLRIEARHLGWDHYLVHLVGAGDAEHDKPALDPVLMALADSGTAPQSTVWFAGDANIDLECAQNAGCTPILVRENKPDSNEVADLPPHHYVPNCSKFKVMVAQALG